MKPIALAIHGGAGTLTRGHMTAEREALYTAALETALAAGYALLEAGKPALDAVQAAVQSLEDCPLFNAGKGAVFTHEGQHEMDAALMEGHSRRAGAVAGISGIQNPIALARAVMDHSGHVLLAGAGAESFAREQGFAVLPAEYFFDDLRYRQWQEALVEGTVMLDHSPLKENKFGTVGAVALDQGGNLAAATSTGGMTNKRFGRVGDTPIIGAGTYANNATCAISCTGSGEYFLRGVVAYDVSCLMEMKGLSLKKACQEVMHKRLKELGGDGGLIGVDALGNICLDFNTEGMYRAAKSSVGTYEVGIYK